jgi:hypothetical protein
MQSCPQWPKHTEAFIHRIFDLERCIHRAWRAAARHGCRHCAAVHCTAHHCTALHCTALHCTALHCTALHCTARTDVRSAALRVPPYTCCAAKPPRRDACLGASGGRHRVIPAVQENERRLTAGRRSHGRPEECGNARDERHISTPSVFRRFGHITTSNSREDGLVLTMRPPRQYRGGHIRRTGGAQLADRTL